MARKSWREKLHPKFETRVEVLEKAGMGMPAGARMLIVHPTVVKAYVDAIPPGERRTVPEMRAELATEYGADVTCPLTSGIFLRIVSELALEELREGKPPSEVSPFWRIVDLKSPLAKKLGEDGMARLGALLAMES